jgi:hypothetical protein
VQDRGWIYLGLAGVAVLAHVRLSTRSRSQCSRIDTATSTLTPVFSRMLQSPPGGPNQSITVGQFRVARSHTPSANRLATESASRMARR